MATVGWRIDKRTEEPATSTMPVFKSNQADGRAELEPAIDSTTSKFDSSAPHLFPGPAPSRGAPIDLLAFCTSQQVHCMSDLEGNRSFLASRRRTTGWRG